MRFYASLDPCGLEEQNGLPGGNKGNGALMCVASGVIPFYDKFDQALKVTELRTKLTHKHELAIEVNKLYTKMLVDAFNCQETKPDNIYNKVILQNLQDPSNYNSNKEARAIIDKALKEEEAYKIPGGTYY